jgi:hypothetical protein
MLYEIEDEIPPTAFRAAIDQSAAVINQTASCNAASC